MDQQKTQNIGIPQHYGSFGYLDHIISFQCVSMIQKIIDSGAFTYRNIILLILILSFDGIRKWLTTFFEKLDIILYINYLINIIRINNNKIVDELEKSQKDSIPYITIKFKPTLAFWEGIINTKKTEIKVTYSKTSEKILNQKNIYEYELTETYANIAIKSPKFEAYIYETLNIKTNHTNDHVSFISATSTSSKIDYNNNPDATSFADLLPFPAFAKEFKKLVFESQKKNIETVIKNLNSKGIYEYFYKSYSANITISNVNFGTLMYTSMPSEYYSTYLIDIYLEMLPILETKYSNWDAIIGLYELYYLLCIVSPTLVNLKKDKIDTFIKSKHFFGCNIDKSKKKNMDSKTFVFYNNDLRHQLMELPNYNEVSKFIHAMILPESYNVSINTIVKEDIEVLIYGDLEEWIKYMQTITNSSKYINFKQNESQIYLLKLVEEEVTETIPNPEYESWEAYAEKLKSTQQTQIQIPPPPSKTCNKTKIITKIASDHVNTIFKDMTNLYLRKEDKSRLMNCLIQFKEKKELLKSLGIPNKLGVLLYGEPGTGKSSTIHAIASFLNKNIYYIQLNEIKTNEQLHMLFNHVTKNCTDGGIIVMEDIDAMTQVVHKRETQTELSSSLTLEFFLNILQGSLTSDGTIFITTTNHLEKLDPAFYRDGRFDVKIEMRAANHYQLQQIYERFFSRQIPEDILEQIPEYKYTPAEFISRFRGYLLDTLNSSNDKIILEPFINNI